MSTADFTIDLPTDSSTSPDAIRLADGRVVVAWQATETEAHFRLFSADGAPMDTEQPLHTAASGRDRAPVLGALADSGFVAIWQEYDSASSSWTLLGQRFDRDGETVGLDFRIDGPAPEDASDAAVTGLADGGFVVTWTAPDGRADGIFQQRYDTFGSRVGGIAAVNVRPGGHQGESAVAGLHGGGWVVAYEDRKGITYKVFGADGSVLHAETDADSLGLAGDMRGPQIAALNGGDFVLTWADGSTGSLYARQFSGDGVAITETFEISPVPGYGFADPDISALDDGGYVITWRDEIHHTVLAQRFDAFSAAVGEPVSALASFNGGTAEPAAVVGLEGGGWVTFASLFDTAGDPHLLGAVREQASGLADFEILTEPGTFDALGGDDVVEGSYGADLIYGGAGDDLLSGGDENDTLIGGTGNDRIHGGLGADVILCGRGDDQVWGGDENEIVKGGAGNDMLDGGRDKDRLYGGTGDDLLIGGGRDDSLIGGDGDDELRGDNGTDRINGGLGNDVMQGGFGPDVFMYRDRDFGEDVILDFQDGLDRLNVKGLIAGFGAVTIEQNGTDAIVSFAGGEIVLRGMSQHVDASDFVF